MPQHVLTTEVVRIVAQVVATLLAGAIHFGLRLRTASWSIFGPDVGN